MTKARGFYWHARFNQFLLCTTIAATSLFIYVYLSLRGKVPDSIGAFCALMMIMMIYHLYAHQLGLKYGHEFCAGLNSLLALDEIFDSKRPKRAF